MPDSLIGLLCDGDLNSKTLVRQYFSLDDLEILAAKQKEKAAATNSDQFKVYPIDSYY